MGKVQSKKNKEKLNSRRGGMTLPSMCGSSPRKYQK